MTSKLTMDAAAGAALLRLPQVEARTGLRRSEIYRRAQCGTFPKPIKIGKSASAWVSTEIDGWIAERVRDSREAA